jgi:hypothetical protein
MVVSNTPIKLFIILISMQSILKENVTLFFVLFCTISSPGPSTVSKKMKLAEPADCSTKNLLLLNNSILTKEALKLMLHVKGLSIRKIGQTLKESESFGILAFHAVPFPPGIMFLRLYFYFIFNK